MTWFKARMIHAVTGNEGAYTFEAAPFLLDASPAVVVKRFMDAIDKQDFPHGHVDYELNVAFKNNDHHVVTAMGGLKLENGPPIPFMLMISAMDDEE